MNKKDIIITVGFLWEICFFMIAGAFLFVSPFLGFIFLVLGIAVAYIVGRAISNNAIEKYQESEK